MEEPPKPEQPSKSGIEPPNSVGMSIMEEPTKHEQPSKSSIEPLNSIEISIKEEPTKPKQPSESGVEPQNSVGISIMEEPLKPEQPSESSVEPLKSDAPLPSQCSDVNVPNESFEHKDGSSTSMPSRSGGEVDVVKLIESNAIVESPGCPHPLEAPIVQPLSSTKLVSSIELVGSSIPSKSGSGHLDSPKPSDVELDAPKTSPLPLESSVESLKASTLPCESGDESPKSRNKSETSIESPKSVTSNEPGGSIAFDTQSMGSSDSPKSGSSLDLRRNSKLMATYSIKRPSKMNFLASQLELVASEREKDVARKQEYKAQEETLMEKRESLLRQMHNEQRKAKFERKASTKAGTSFMIDLNATKKDMRKEDLNKKKEEDERNKNLLLQRARDEKMLRKSIYKSDKSSLGSSSPGTPSPTSSSPSITEE